MAALKTFAQPQNAAREGSKFPFKPVEEPIALMSEVFERQEVQLPIDHMDKICRD